MIEIEKNNNKINDIISSNNVDTNDNLEIFKDTILSQSILNACATEFNKVLPLEKTDSSITLSKTYVMPSCSIFDVIKYRGDANRAINLTKFRQYDKIVDDYDEISFLYKSTVNHTNKLDKQVENFLFDSSDEDTNFLFIEGSAASGKSSYIKFFADKIIHSKKYYDTFSNIHFIILKELSKDLVVNPLESIIDYTGENDFNNSLIVLEGFDELCDYVLGDINPNIFLLQLLQSINKFNCKVIITTSPGYLAINDDLKTYENIGDLCTLMDNYSCEDSFLRIKKLRINPFSKNNVLSYLNKCCTNEDVIDNVINIIDSNTYDKNIFHNPFYLYLISKNTSNKVHAFSSLWEIFDNVFKNKDDALENEYCLFHSDIRDYFLSEYILQKMNYIYDKFENEIKESKESIQEMKLSKYGKEIQFFMEEFEVNDKIALFLKGHIKHIFSDSKLLNKNKFLKYIKLNYKKNEYRQKYDIFKDMIEHNMVYSFNSYYQNNIYDSQKRIFNNIYNIYHIVLKNVYDIDKELINFYSFENKILYQSYIYIMMTTIKIKDFSYLTLKNAYLGLANLKDANLSNCNLENTNFNNAILKRAILKNTNLKNSTMQGAYMKCVDLDNACLDSAHLEEAILQEANMQNTSLVKSFLQRANLDEANMYKANLEGALINVANLRGCNLNLANLHKTRLVKSHLEWSNMKEVNLSEACLDGAYLKSVHLEKANMQKISLKNSNLKQAILIEADLSFAKLNGSNLGWADFSKANLSEANLDDTDLEDAKMKRANLTYASLSNSHLRKTNFEKANLSGANLQGADMKWVHLEGANLSGANLEGANLHGAFIEKANFKGANLKNTNLTWVNMDLANFEGANLEGAQLERKGYKS